MKKSKVKSKSTYQEMEEMVDRFQYLAWKFKHDRLDRMFLDQFSPLKARKGRKK